MDGLHGRELDSTVEAIAVNGNQVSLVMVKVNEQRKTEYGVSGL